ncbi:MAG: gfo/Idh/MocA family oxidoreductase [Dehalococcoidia bacterium]|nr:gfo/Idh/MocA family oxidoreductase [Dehalococcoidia bacterium]
MASTMRFGVIGLGRAGAGMLAAMAEHPDIEVTAAADIYKEHLTRFKEEFGGQTFTEAADLVRSKEVDAVYIATPHQFHVDHVLLAAEHGKHVIVEKPMALTLADCDEMIEIAKRTGIKMIVGHTASYNPGVMRMRQLIANEEFGKLGMISATAYTDFLYRPRRPEELVTELGGGIIFNQVPHQVDASRYIGGGMVRSVRAMTWVLDTNRPTEGAYMAMLEFESGAGASLVYSGYDHFNSGEIASAKGRRAPESFGAVRRELGIRDPEEETAMRIATGYGGNTPRRRPPAMIEGAERPPVTQRAEGNGASRQRGGDGEGRQGLAQAELGSFIVTCEGADLRLTDDGVLAYSTAGLRDLGASPWRGTPGRGNVIDELFFAVTENRPVIHHPAWAKATMEVCLGFLDSAREHRDVSMRYQVPTVDISP